MKNPGTITCPSTIWEVPYSHLLEEDKSLKQTLNYIVT